MFLQIIIYVNDQLPDWVFMNRPWIQDLTGIGLPAWMLVWAFSQMRNRIRKLFRNIRDRIRKKLIRKAGNKNAIQPVPVMISSGKIYQNLVWIRVMWITFRWIDLITSDLPWITITFSPKSDVIKKWIFVNNNSIFREAV